MRCIVNFIIFLFLVTSNFSNASEITEEDLAAVYTSDVSVSTEEKIIIERIAYIKVFGAQPYGCESTGENLLWGNRKQNCLTASSAIMDHLFYNSRSSSPKNFYKLSKTKFKVQDYAGKNIYYDHDAYALPYDSAPVCLGSDKLKDVFVGSGDPQPWRPEKYGVIEIERELLQDNSEPRNRKYGRVARVLLDGKLVKSLERQDVSFVFESRCRITSNKNYNSYLRLFTDQAAENICNDLFSTKAKYAGTKEKSGIMTKTVGTLFTLGTSINERDISAIYVCDEPIQELVEKKDQYFKKKYDDIVKKDVELKLKEKKLALIKLNKKQKIINDEKKLKANQKITKRNEMIEECTEIGFTAGTEAMGNCVLRLMEFETKLNKNNSVGSETSSGEVLQVEKQKLKELKKQTEAARNRAATAEAEANAAERQAEALEKANKAAKRKRALDAAQKGLDILNCTTWPIC